jgi:hypothetical protein
MGATLGLATKGVKTLTTAMSFSLTIPSDLDLK